MESPVWVSHPDSLRAAARKPLQLTLARRFGFTTPRTLLTNDPQAARDFSDSCAGRIIAKATGSGWIYDANSDPDVQFVLTNRVSAEALKADDAIQVAPITFQEEIAKAYELRVHVVGSQILAVKIESQSSSISELDWRRYDVGQTPYRPYQLPVTLELQCLRLTKALGLEFGAIDLIRRPDGAYVFLEINGNGQFLWAEQLSGVRVSDALVNLLAGRISPLKSTPLD